MRVTAAQADFKAKEGSAHPWSAILFGTTRMTVHALWQLVGVLPSLGWLATQAIMGRGKTSRSLTAATKARSTMALPVCRSASVLCECGV